MENYRIQSTQSKKQVKLNSVLLKSLYKCGKKKKKKKERKKERKKNKDVINPKFRINIYSEFLNCKDYFVCQYSAQFKKENRLTQ